MNSETTVLNLKKERVYCYYFSCRLSEPELFCHFLIDKTDVLTLVYYAMHITSIFKAEKYVTFT